MNYRTFEHRTLTCMGCGVTQKLRYEVSTGPSRCEGCGALEWMALPKLEAQTEPERPQVITSDDGPEVIAGYFTVSRQLAREWGWIA